MKFGQRDTNFRRCDDWSFDHFDFDHFRPFTLKIQQIRKIKNPDIDRGFEFQIKILILHLLCLLSWNKNFDWDFNLLNRNRSKSLFMDRCSFFLRNFCYN